VNIAYFRPLSWVNEDKVKDTQIFVQMAHKYIDDVPSEPMYLVSLNITHVVINIYINCSAFLLFTCFSVMMYTS